MFPEGIIVGVVDKRERDMSGNFVTLRIKLSTDFSQLSTVRAITNTIKNELKDIERQDEKGDDNATLQEEAVKQ